MESLVLSPQDVENLEAMSDGSTGYFYKMLDYLEKRVEDGVRRGRFSEEAAKADLETALWYSYACNNLDEYESYCRAAQWMAASEGSAEAARCGMWYYRYSCALLYCGRLEEALDYAEKGVAVEPDYVWGWLQLGKLRSHFGDTAGALAAVERHEVTPALEDSLLARVREAAALYSPETQLLLNPAEETLRGIFAEADVVVGTGDFTLEGMGAPLIPAVNETTSLSFPSYVRTVRRMCRRLEHGTERSSLLLGKMPFQSRHYPLYCNQSNLAAKEMWSRMWLNRKGDSV